VRERKRAVRLVIEDVTVHKAEQIVAHIRFKGGAMQTITVALPPPFAQSRLTAPSTLEAIDRLLDEYTDAQVAEQLNQRGSYWLLGSSVQKLALGDGQNSSSPTCKHRRVGVQSEIVNSIFLLERRDSHMMEKFLVWLVF